MTHNPFSNPVFLPTLLRIAGVLLLLLAGAIWRRRNRARQGMHSSMLTKVLTALWVAPVLITGLFAGGIIFSIIILVISIKAMQEYAALVGLGRWYLAILDAFSVAGIGIAMAGRGVLLLASPFIVFLVTTLVPIISGNVEDAHRQVCGTITGYLYISIPMSLAIYIRQYLSWGLPFLVLTGTAVAFADAGASVVGPWLKGPKLAPRVSPAKTWSGVGGAAVGAGAGLALLWIIVPPKWNVGTAAIIWVTSAIGAIWGDLIESFVKRDFAVKDAGKVLVGFGGVLDRFDSFFVAIPMTYGALVMLRLAGLI